MSPQTRSPKSSAKHSARLGAYLAAGLGASAAATSTVDAAIININIGPSGFNIGGINGGVIFGYNTINNFPFAGAGTLEIYNSGGDIGVDGDFGLMLAINGGYASPRNFALGASISDTASFTGIHDDSLFRYDEDFVSPDFGPGSYMGFKTATNNYGWLEVTWNSKSSQFQILSGAYEDVAGVAILAGATASAAVPEPSTWAMSALLAGGVAFTVWRKRRAATQAKAQAA